MKKIEFEIDIQFANPPEGENSKKRTPQEFTLNLGVGVDFNVGDSVCVNNRSAPK